MTTATVDGPVVLAVLATLAAMIMIGLGFLYRPTLATLLWSLGFILITIASYGVLIAQATEMPRLAEVSEGLMMGAPALVWSGLRAARGVRAHAWAGPAIGAAAALVLTMSLDTPVHPLVYSSAYLLSSLWAALTVVEVMRRRERDVGRLLPLVLISGALPVIGAASIVAAVVGALSGSEQHVLPDLKAIGGIAYLRCALVSLLALARNPMESPTYESEDFFSHVAQERLARAQSSGETTWSLLAVSLDDTGALRVAGGEEAFRRIVDRLGAEVRSAFPADADIGPDGASGFFILVSRPDIAVRDCVRDLLDRVSTVRDDQPLAVEFSASVGWASVRADGYDLDALVAAAQTAMESARAEGGHRWERASAE